MINRCIGDQGTLALLRRNRAITSKAITNETVPEPEIYALMAVGVGVMGWAVRRQKRMQSTVVRRLTPALTTPLRRGFFIRANTNSRPPSSAPRRSNGIVDVGTTLKCCENGAISQACTLNALYCRLVRRYVTTAHRGLFHQWV